MRNFRVWLSLTIAGLGFSVASPVKAFTLTDVWTGADMAGMEVTVNFEGGSSETGVWAATGLDSGEAVGTDWGLSLSGNSNVVGWTFENVGSQVISSLLIDAPPGNTVFDILFLPELTPGSGRGNPFAGSGIPAPQGTYSGNLPGTLGDIKTSLEIVFPEGLTKNDDPVLFVADTDGVVDDVTVPEPGATLALLGVLGFGTFVHQKRAIRDSKTRRAQMQPKVKFL